eukprot:3941968-Rhodomonas_salina.7
MSCADDRGRRATRPSLPQTSQGRSSSTPSILRSAALHMRPREATENALHNSPRKDLPPKVASCTLEMRSLLSTRSPARGPQVPPPYAMSGTDLRDLRYWLALCPYAGARASQVSYAIALRPCYVMSGIGTQYVDVALRWLCNVRVGTWVELTLIPAVKLVQVPIVLPASSSYPLAMLSS